ncbi:MAG: transposase [Roseiflexus sp.]|nr:transposase [Roseiflexus sp.]MBO9336838.1 transposase [Roseiflexus sp.]MBO9340617.1 transposase [Roseiflexus sp.]MBO9365619.1 transposase [Roseiflexus sp.]MBO9381827.1 transposase [Roseiflexus sp.]
MCAVCGWKNEALTSNNQERRCPECGTHHDRDHNAAINLKQLATGTALPVVSPSGDGGAGETQNVSPVGKVTPVRNKPGH